MTARRGLKIAALLHETRRRWVRSSCDFSGEGRNVVKGTNRRVVVVRSPDESIFEQAIFIVRDDYRPSEREGAKRVVDEARRAAGAYMARLRPARRRRILWPLLAALGAIAAAGVYAVMRFGGVLF